MAHRFLKLVDPLLLDDDSNKSSNNERQTPETDRSVKKDENNALIKLYKKPIISYALLPGIDSIELTSLINETIFLHAILNIRWLLLFERL